MRVCGMCKDLQGVCSESVSLNKFFVYLLSLSIQTQTLHFHRERVCVPLEEILISHKFSTQKH